MSETQVVTYTAQPPLAHPAILLRRVCRDVVCSRHVAYQMMKRDLRSQYRTSLAGVLIPVLPALTTAAWAILFRDAHLINVGAIGLPYPFFVLCGMMLWAAFLEAIEAPIGGVKAEQGLLSKADVPPEAVTLARLGQMSINFCVKVVIIAIAAVAYRVHVPWTMVLAPAGLLIIVALGLAIGLILAPINLLYTDVAKALPIVTTFWFFTTPILFNAPRQGTAAILMERLNPMTALLTTTRELAFGGGLSMPRAAGTATLLTLGLLLAGAIFHRVAMPIVIDRANA